MSLQRITRVTRPSVPPRPNEMGLNPHCMGLRFTIIDLRWDKREVVRGSSSQLAPLIMNFFFSFKKLESSYLVDDSE